MEAMEVDQPVQEENILVCVICQDIITEGQAKSKLTKKGCATINAVSSKFLEDGHIYAQVGRYVHIHCRETYTNKNNVSAREINRDNTVLTSPKKKRSERRESDCPDEPKCLFCEQAQKLNNKGLQQQGKLIPVRTVGFQDTVLSYCQKRGAGDRWARDVKGRIQYLQDLFAKDAVYHNVCLSNFRSGFQIPKLFHTVSRLTSEAPTGRPVNKDVSEAFLHVVDYLDSADIDQVTVFDLVRIMGGKLAHREKTYCKSYMKKKLKEHYGDKIVFAEKAGVKDVVCFKETASSILRNFYDSPKPSDPETQKKQLIETAAQLIRSDIKAMASNKDSYPNIIQEELLSFLPDTLTCLLTSVCRGKNLNLKLAAIGQAIVQCTRPKTVLAPLQFGLGVQMHKIFASRFLIDTLNHLGFSCSYAEVRTFRMNAVAQDGLQLPPAADGVTLQFVADNVDHNTVTLDGRNTFHGMGIIAVTTPGGNRPSRIPRKDIKLKDIKNIGRIGIYFYRSGWKNLSTLRLMHLADIPAEDPTAHLETLWKVSWPLKSPRPSWKGMMQVMHTGDHPGPSEVVFMPMINLNPGDMSCIYSTLRFVTDQAMKQQVVPIITFDQPLYMKALSIISSDRDSSDLKAIVLRLGVFHMQMSFLGSIGNIMSGSGIHQALEILFAQNTVTHVISGKAYDRAVRGYILISAALYALLTADAFQMPWLLIHHESEQADEADIVEVEGVFDPEATDPKEDQTSAYDVETTHTSVSGDVCVTECEELEEAKPSTGNSDLDQAVVFLEKALKGDLSSETKVKESLEKVCIQLEAHKQSLLACRTSRLWLQFLDMIDVLLKSIKAERTGNFLLHLQSVQEMLPYFAASGHNYYLKSAWLYLQDMLELENRHPDVFQRFLAGHHCIRRSDRHWAGLSSDLIIEQTLMRSLKTSGGLTRGSGMGETERLLWLLGMPASAQVNTLMQLATGVVFGTSEQHKDCSQGRLDRDHVDTLKILKYFLSRNPFDNGDQKLRDLSTGREAGEDVNVDTAKQVGQDIIKGMAGKTLEDVQLKKSDQAVTMASKTATVVVNNEQITVDTNLLFQRLIKVAQTTPERLPLCFYFELTSVPSALFDKSGMPREAKKHELAKYISSTTKQDLQQPPRDATHVLDGGSLLYTQSWSNSMTFGHLIECYVDYVKRNYGKATVVFDGYRNGPSTKDAAHLRRKNGLKTSRDVCFDDDMLVSDARESFLSNPANKQRFIDGLARALAENGVEVRQQEGDADCGIVRTVLEKATVSPTTLVAKDTDLLILLLYHTKQHHNTVYMAAGEKNWNIKAAQAGLNAKCTDLCRTLLFCHAISGCDTTSGLFSIGKGTVLKKAATSPAFREQAQVFLTQHNSCDNVVEAGEKALVFLFSNGKEQCDLDTLRYIKYEQKLATSTSSLEPQKLPPTSSAAQFHSMRVYYQVQEWMLLKGEEHDMDPLEWGWTLTDDIMFPVYTNKAPAPDDLLCVIRCTCKTDCLTLKCSCRHYGLPCTVSCANCKGASCFNGMRCISEETDESEY